MQLPKYTYIHFFLFFFILSVLSISFFFEYYRGMLPCLLCISQRIMLMGAELIVFFAIVLRPVNLRCYGILIFLTGLIGLLLAIRQIYLESIPLTTHEACIPGLKMLIKILPWQEILKTMIMGTPECGAIHWSFLGFSVSYWMCIIFLFILYIGWIDITHKAN